MLGKTPVEELLDLIREKLDFHKRRLGQFGPPQKDPSTEEWTYRDHELFNSQKVLMDYHQEKIWLYEKLLRKVGLD